MSPIWDIRVSITLHSDIMTLEILKISDNIICISSDIDVDTYASKSFQFVVEASDEKFCDSLFDDH